MDLIENEFIERKRKKKKKGTNFWQFDIFLPIRLMIIEIIKRVWGMRLAKVFFLSDWHIDQKNLLSDMRRGKLIDDIIIKLQSYILFSFFLIYCFQLITTISFNYFENYKNFISWSNKFYHWESLSVELFLTIASKNLLQNFLSRLEKLCLDIVIHNSKIYVNWTQTSDCHTSRGKIRH